MISLDDVAPTFFFSSSGCVAAARLLAPLDSSIAPDDVLIWFFATKIEALDGFAWSVVLAGMVLIWFLGLSAMT